MAAGQNTSDQKTQQCPRARAEVNGESILHGTLLLCDLENKIKKQERDTELPCSTRQTGHWSHCALEKMAIRALGTVMEYSATMFRCPAKQAVCAHGPGPLSKDY